MRKTSCTTSSISLGATEALDDAGHLATMREEQLPEGVTVSRTHALDEALVLGHRAPVDRDSCPASGRPPGKTIALAHEDTTRLLHPIRC